MVKRHWQLAVVATCTLAGLAGLAAESHSHADEKLTIVAFGDSTTAPRGKLTVYADLLRQQLPEHDLSVQVVNAGVGGNDTNLARARFDRDVLAHAPDIVIIQFGINDAAVDVWKNPPATEPRISLEEYAENLRHILKALKDRQVQVILMTPNPLRWTEKLRELYGKPPYLPDETDGFNIKLKAYAHTVRQIAKAENVELVDIFREFENYGLVEGQRVDDLLLDGMHPNAAGQRMIADRLLAPLLKLAKPSAGNR